jgi:hypothetical protein
MQYDIQNRDRTRPSRQLGGAPLARQKDGDQAELQNSAVKIAPGTRDFQQTRIVGMLQSFQLTRIRVTSREALKAADHFQAGHDPRALCLSGCAFRALGRPANCDRMMIPALQLSRLDAEARLLGTSP